MLLVAVGQAGTREKWHLWKERHNKVYLNESEEASRKQTWLRNLLKISDHNSRNVTFVMELNQFADLVSIALIVQSALASFHYFVL